MLAKEGPLMTSRSPLLQLLPRTKRRRRDFAIFTDQTKEFFVQKSSEQSVQAHAEGGLAGARGAMVGHQARCFWNDA